MTQKRLLEYWKNENDRAYFSGLRPTAHAPYAFLRALTAGARSMRTTRRSIVEGGNLTLEAGKRKLFPAILT